MRKLHHARTRLRILDSWPVGINLAPEQEGRRRAVPMPDAAQTQSCMNATPSRFRLRKRNQQYPGQDFFRVGEGEGLGVKKFFNVWPNFAKADSGGFLFWRDDDRAPADCI